jgi:hypothetical protein
MKEFGCIEKHRFRFSIFFWLIDRSPLFLPLVCLLNHGILLYLFSAFMFHITMDKRRARHTTRPLKWKISSYNSPGYLQSFEEISSPVPDGDLPTFEATFEACLGLKQFFVIDCEIVIRNWLEYEDFQVTEVCYRFDEISRMIPFDRFDRFDF